MATVNFSVPEKVKEAFNRTFKDENKNAVLARLMRQAVDERRRQKRRALGGRRAAAAARPHAPRDE